MNMNPGEDGDKEGTVLSQVKWKRVAYFCCMAVVENPKVGEIWLTVSILW